jgi:kynurenine formamidase
MNKKAIDISIPLKFNGPQPNAYGVEPAKAEPVRAGSLVGDTRQGGSVNFEQYTFIPHCSGTHTECVGHITHDRISIRDCLHDILIPAILISVTPELIDNEPLISRLSLEASIDVLESGIGTPEALVIRTLPNDPAKLIRRYGTDDPDSVRIPPYFAADAMRFIVEHGFRHLLVDLPSIDRLYDDGALINHRMFWKVDEGSFEVNSETRTDSTITELIYVPDEVADGQYTLNLQIAPFDSDCAPSRPVLLS